MINPGGVSTPVRVELFVLPRALLPRVLELNDGDDLLVALAELVNPVDRWEESPTSPDREPKQLLTAFINNLATAVDAAR